MTTWKEIKKLYREDKAILKMISLTITVANNEDFFGPSLRDLPLSEDKDLTLLDLVVARQRDLNQELKEEEIKILVNLQSQEDFMVMAIKSLEDLLSYFKES